MAAGVSLRDVKNEDLPQFYIFQLDPEANRMAAFTARDPTDRNAFMQHWRKIMSDETVTLKTILFNGEAAGSIVRYVLEGSPQVGYWVGKEYWGRGIATQALSEFLKLIHERPLFAHVAKDNFASIRVLEKCGFEMIGEGKEFSNARGEEVEEYIYKLSSIPVFPDEISEWAFD